MASMDPVSNANRIAMLLRQRLQERAKGGAAARSGRKEAGPADGTAGKSAVRGAGAIGALDDRKLKRALIENILADQLGNGLINEAQFQQVVDQVTETIEADADGGPLLARVVADLRAGAG
jgi:hypothetical protein